MGRISRKREIKVLDIEPEEKKISYCPHCLEFEFKEPLGPRILLKGESKPTDYDQWLQCLACGNIYPIYEAKIESKLQDFIEVSDNPFDIGQTIVGLGNKVKKTRHQKELQTLRNKIDYERDEDIKKEFKKGYTVEIIEDY